MLHYKIEIVSSIFSLLISLYSFNKQSVSLSGFISMLIVSFFLIWNDGLDVLTVMFTMFASATLLTKFKQQYKSILTEKILNKLGPRDAVQALCNLGTGFICFLLFHFTNDSNYILALLCSVAASNADTWASEIGVLSKQKPVLITTFKTCESGISGGISVLGTIAGVSGSVFIALISIALIDSLEYAKFTVFIIISAAGIIGFVLDSILGATLQVIYKDGNGLETENTHFGKSKSRGIKWINNDVVNFISSFSISVLVLIGSKYSFF